MVFESFGQVPTPVNLTFVIYKEGEEIHREEDYLVVEVEELLTKNFGLGLEEGEYEIVLTTLYGDNVEDEFKHDFIVKKSFWFKFKSFFKRLFSFLFIFPASQSSICRQGNF